IYAQPINDEIFEIFHCNRWRESASVEIIHLDAALLPTVPVEIVINNLTSVGIPPLPLLNNPFISDDVKNLQCQMFDDCTCVPAETKANCYCKNLPIGTWFKSKRNQLPVLYPSLTFRQDASARVQATVTNMVTGEIVLSFQDTLETEILVDDDVCRVTASDLKGCYNRVKGSVAEAICFSSRDGSLAEIVCGETSFTIPCNTTESRSDLRFSLTKARINFACVVSCGRVTTSFDIAGILKFTASAQGLVEQWLSGESVSLSEIQWPDLAHIARVFLQWHKTLAIAIVTLLIAIAITYLVFTTCGMRIIFWLGTQHAKSLLQLVGLFWRFLRFTCVNLIVSAHRKQQ
ncbi:unnamed protein product, partial [Heligmosomoides polygyrus]|uniref:Phlebovirus_G2 domain-containing protein n=1 Tax=Heligmosomoides polygyrus TaxID=6339 RepID=A0A183GSQ6_HELPZ